MKRLKALFNQGRKYIHRKSIQFMISISFTLVAIGCMVTMGLLLYTQSTKSLKNTLIQENQQLVNQISLNVYSYTQNMKRISNTMYYSVIKKTDLEKNNLNKELALLYEVKDSLISIACFRENGEVVGAAPISTIKKDIDITKQEWFIRANDIIENPQFSLPHVQNIFEDANRYRWVISLSQMVELNYGGIPERGVLLVDMSYSGIEQIFTQMTSDNAGYIYLVDSSGELIYHPHQKLIYSGLYNENNTLAAKYADGKYEEVFEGVKRQVVVKTVGYTGWKVISVIPNSEFTVSFGQMRTLAFFIIGLAVVFLVVANSFVSSRVANPIKKLEESVKDLEQGQLDLDIHVGGPYEIQRLGITIKSVVEQMRGLMDDILKEQEQKRKSEFNALQAQINPHFLYNTLDSIVWMIESGKHAEAIPMVTALANLFRISLSKGKNIITIGTELRHAAYYLQIQKVRYKNNFVVREEIDPQIEEYSTIKLIIQPLLENAIYHAMEPMDGDGELCIRGYKQQQDVYIEIIDNGLGMTQEKVNSLLQGDELPVAGKKGSGIGLRNVDQRIKLYYGAAYGLEIESELDVGTTARIHLPALKMNEVSQEGKEGLS
ncbi:MAG: sensor histidine kinase [Clostridiales bacterium]|nr:sensor histidine kinase [Clostridiales bacterium]